MEVIITDILLKIDYVIWNYCTYWEIHPFRMVQELIHSEDPSAAVKIPQPLWRPLSCCEDPSAAVKIPCCKDPSPTVKVPQLPWITLVRDEKTPPTHHERSSASVKISHSQRQRLVDYRPLPWKSHAHCKNALHPAQKSLACWKDPSPTEKRALYYREHPSPFSVKVTTIARPKEPPQWRNA